MQEKVIHHYQGALLPRRIDYWDEEQGIPSVLMTMASRTPLEIPRGWIYAIDRRVVHILATVNLHRDLLRYLHTCARSWPGCCPVHWLRSILSSGSSDFNLVREC